MIDERNCFTGSGCTIVGDKGRNLQRQRGGGSERDKAINNDKAFQDGV